MSGMPFTNPAGGFWPLGLITVIESGTAVALTLNVGRNGQGPMHLPRRIRQLILSADPRNTGNVYLVMSGYTHRNTNGVIVVLPPRQIAALPHGCLLEGTAVNVDNYYLDAEIDGDGAYATAIYG